jgi:hypothetical protein
VQFSDDLGGSFTQLGGEISGGIQRLGKAVRCPILMRRLTPRKLWLACALVVSSLGAGILIAEAGLSRFWPLPPVLTDQMTPLDQAAGWGPDLDAEGRRVCDAHLPEARTPGKRRVLLLGDSVLGCNRKNRPYAASLAGLLEAKLGEGYEIVTLQGGGWGTDQELLAFEAVGSKYRADEVLLFFTPANELANNASDFALWEEKPKPRFGFDENNALVLHDLPLKQPHWWNRAARWLIRTEVGKRVFLAFHRPSVSEGSGKLERDLHAHLRAFVTPMPENIESSWRVTRAILHRLKERVAATGARLSLVYVPNGILQSCRLKGPGSGPITCLGFREEPVRIPCLGDTLLDAYQPFRILSDFSKDIGIPLVHNVDQMPAYVDRQFDIVEDCIHLTLEGRELLADRVAAHLLGAGSDPAISNRAGE